MPVILLKISRAQQVEEVGEGAPSAWAVKADERRAQKR